MAIHGRTSCANNSSCRCERSFERCETGNTARNGDEDCRICVEVVVFGALRSDVLRGVKGMKETSTQYVYTSEMQRGRETESQGNDKM